MNIAVGYAKKEQSNPLEIWNNKEVSLRFKRFLKGLGINEEIPCVKTEWSNRGLVYYLAHVMDEDEVRREIGNTTAVIIFHDVGAKFDPKDLKLAGKLTQFVIIVQPVEPDNYRLGLVYKDTLRPFEPKLPSNYVFDAHQLKEFILHKVHNGYMMTQYCPPLNRMFEQPRQATIHGLAEKWEKSECFKE